MLARNEWSNGRLVYFVQLWVTCYQSFHLKIDRMNGSQDSTSRLNDSSQLCDSDSLLGSLLTRYQVNFKVYFTVCRQLWWHYVNIAGTSEQLIVISLALLSIVNLFHMNSKSYGVRSFIQGIMLFCFIFWLLEDMRVHDRFKVKWNDSSCIKNGWYHCSERDIQEGSAQANTRR